VATNKKLLTAEPLPTLTSLLQGADVKLVEIGGRGSTFPDLVTLAPFAHYYVSEPDASEAARLADHLNGIGWRSVTVLTDAIGLACGDATLFHTAEPGMSSLLEPDPEVARRFYLRDKFRVVGTSTVSVTTLDEAALRYSFNDACFLKIDTQGTELDILRSGETLLRQSLLAVYVECSFRPFYRGQALFGEVDSYLRAQGLELFSLSRTNLRRADYPAGRYSRRVTAWAHCLYFREADTLVTAERSHAGA
jgi:FkbM family methyltransferase